MMVPGPFWIQWYHLFLDYPLRNKKTRPTVASYLSCQDTHNTYRHRHMLFFSLFRFQWMSFIHEKKTRLVWACMYVYICKISTASFGACMWLCNPHPRIHNTQHTHRTDRPTEKKEKESTHIIQTLQILVLCACHPFSLSLTLSLCHLIRHEKMITYPGYVISHDQIFLYLPIVYHITYKKEVHQQVYPGGWMGDMTCNVSPALCTSLLYAGAAAAACNRLFRSVIIELVPLLCFSLPVRLV